MKKSIVAYQELNICLIRDIYLWIQENMNN